MYIVKNLNPEVILYYVLFLQLLQEIRRRGLQVAVAGIPKTIDNDIAVIFLVPSKKLLLPTS
jgi:hypothetical protein